MLVLVACNIAKLEKEKRNRFTAKHLDFVYQSAFKRARALTARLVRAA